MLFRSLFHRGYNPRTLPPEFTTWFDFVAAEGDASAPEAECLGRFRHWFVMLACNVAGPRDTKVDDKLQNELPALLRESCRSLHETKRRLLRGRQKETCTPSKYPTGGVPVRQPLKTRRQLFAAGDWQNFPVFNGNLPVFELKA